MNDHFLWAFFMTESHGEHAGAVVGLARAVAAPSGDPSAQHAELLVIALRDAGIAVVVLVATGLPRGVSVLALLGAGVHHAVSDAGVAEVAFVAHPGAFGGGAGLAVAGAAHAD